MCFTTVSCLIKGILSMKTQSYRERNLTLKNRTRGIIIGVVLLALLTYFIWPRENRQETMEVDAASVTQQDFKDVISTLGILEALKTESFVGQGLVNEVNVAIGDEVEADEVLVTYIDGTQLLAPFAGTVVELNVEAEKADTNAQQNQASLVLADLSQLEVAVALSKNEANRVAVEQEVALDYLDKSYQGIVDRIDLVASSPSTAATSSAFQSSQSAPSLRAVIAFETEDLSELIVGFDIDVDIITDTTSNSLAIPIESLLHNEAGTPYVFLIEDGLVLEREITTGIQEGVMIEVISGLDANDKVVRLPSEDLADGMEVTVVTPDDDEANE